MWDWSFPGVFYRPDQFLLNMLFKQKPTTLSEKMVTVAKNSLGFPKEKKGDFSSIQRIGFIFSRFMEQRMETNTVDREMTLQPLPHSSSISVQNVFCQPLSTVSQKWEYRKKAIMNTPLTIKVLGKNPKVEAIAGSIIRVT